jgi:hypothetical protein
MKKLHLFLMILLSWFMIACIKSSNKLKFQKIIYHTSGCFGTCPTYHIQLDSNGQVNLFSEFVYLNDEGLDHSNPDSSRMGYFTGSIADTTLTRIQEELYKINLEDLKIDGSNCCDASMKVFIIYYDNKRKYIEAMFLPNKMKKLNNLLYSSCNPDKLTRTTEKLNIEEPQPPWGHD